MPTPISRSLGLDDAADEVERGDNVTRQDQQGEDGEELLVAVDVVVEHAVPAVGGERADLDGGLRELFSERSSGSLGGAAAAVHAGGKSDRCLAHLTGGTG